MEGANFEVRDSLGVVDGHRKISARQASTNAQIERIATGELGRKLLSQLAGWHPECSPEEIEDAFQTACQRAADGLCQGTAEGEVFTFLRITAHRWLNREGYNRRREVPSDPSCGSLDRPDSIPPEQTVIDREDDHDVLVLARKIIAGLSSRHRDVLALHLAGASRHEIAASLGLSERAVKRDVERIMAQARRELVDLVGGGCADGEPLAMRLACGLMSGSKTAEAHAHLATCPRCAELFRRLELWREKAGALLPAPPTVEQAQPGTLERALHSIGDGLGAARRHIADSTGLFRQQASEAPSQLKQQATNVYYRALDPTPLAGARPGAVAAVVAGCVALGGGTYTCVEQGINPLTTIPGLGEPGGDRNAAGKGPARVETVQPVPVEPDPPVEQPKPTPAPEVPDQPVEVAPSEPAPAPASGGDSLSGLSGNPTPTPAPAPAPPPTSSSDGSDTTFGGL